jgi:hypothetical protein
MLGEIRFKPDGTAEPIFFHAQLRRGVLYVPQHIYNGGNSHAPATTGEV